MKIIFKKLVAVMISAAMTAAFTMPMNTYAGLSFIDDALKVPEEYGEYIDSEGFFSQYSSGNAYSVYFRENAETNQNDLLIYFDYRYNDTVLHVVNEKFDEFDAIFEKYREPLDMDHYVRNEPPLEQPESDVTANIFDRFDENGYTTNDPSDMEDKSELIKEMTAELYKSGCITEADYRSMAAYSITGYCSSVMSVYLNSASEASEADALAEIAASFDSVDSIEYNGDHYDIDIALDEAAGFLNAVRAKYPDAEGSISSGFDMSAETAASQSLNLLAPIKEAEACDINASGTADLDDAVLVLTHYANTAAGIVTADDTRSMDVNGDGSVNLDDAVLVLTVYSETVAGLR